MILKTRYLYIFIFSFLLVTSCNSGIEPIEEKQVEELSIPLEEETVEEEDNENPVIEEISSFKKAEEIENKKRIEKVYGKQWGFCECVIKSDSVNIALMNADDDEFDKVMERSNYIDDKCKQMLTGPNGTPEERSTHKLRVQKCLKQNKK